MKNEPQYKRIIKINDNLTKSKLNLIEADNIIITVISQVNIMTNMIDWVIDCVVTMHICVNKNNFISNIQVEEGE